MTRPDALAGQDWSLWSTVARLVVTDGSLLPDARALVEDYLGLVDDAANRFREDSEIRRLAAGPEGTVELSPVLADLVAAALEAARDSRGAVDPTVGTAMRRIGYDRDLALVLAQDTPVRAVVSHVPGWSRLRLEGRRLHLPEGVELDLGATAKAVAADRCAALVAERLATGVLVGLGGDLATAGPAPAGGWQVHVQDRAEDPATQVSLPAGAAMATSSTVKRRWTRGGRPLHHIVDPTTGQPAPATWRSVTVADSSCLRANTATTTAVVLGRRAPAWLRERGVPARLLHADGSIVLVGAWPRETEAA